MYFTAKSLDDLMRQVLERLLRGQNSVNPSKGKNTEDMGVLLKLANPRVRLSRTETKGTVFSALGELLWYLAGSKQLDFIQYYISTYHKYSDDGVTVHGGYGPRLFQLEREGKKINQLENVVALLKKSSDSRRAVIQLFDGEDIHGPRRNDVPCTCTLQFLIRERLLYLSTTMRSNDAFRGLPHDVFCFTMLQEIVARKLGIELGYYKHYVSSLHLYDENISAAKRFMNEGWHEPVPMPPMPLGDPDPAIAELLACEHALRKRAQMPAREHTKQGYWADLVRLLQVQQFVTHSRSHQSAKAKIAKVKAQMSSSYFNIYIQKRQNRGKTKPVLEQLLLLEEKDR